jgi:hypothetical protein
MTTVNAQVMKAAKIVALALCGAALGGCAKHTRPAAASMEPEPTPLVIDEATQMRDWDRSTAYYANGDVPGPPVREKFGRKPNTGNEYLDTLFEPIYFAGNVLYLPISLIEQPLGTEVWSTGVQVARPAARAEARNDDAGDGADDRKPDAAEGHGRGGRRRGSAIRPATERVRKAPGADARRDSRASA